MKLYDIPCALEEMIDKETGEISDIEAFQALKMERDRKIEFFALMYKNGISMKKALEEEIKALQARAKSEASKAERIKALLAGVLNGERFETPKCKITFRKTPESVSVDGDAEKIIRWMEGNLPQFVKVRKELEKAEIKAALKDGAKIPGVSLKSGTTIQIG